MPCNTVNSDMFSFMQDTLRIRCPFSYVSIQEGVDSSATTTNTHAERLVQVCHIELNAQGVTEPGQQGSQEDPGLLLDHHGLCHYRLLSEHDVNYTKAANVKLTKLWADEARTCSQQAELLDEHMRITWHNVNGITGFIAALSLNPDGYFLSGLIPDMFGILEAKVYEQDQKTPALIQSLETRLVSPRCRWEVLPRLTLDTLNL